MSACIGRGLAIQMVAYVDGVGEEGEGSGDFHLEAKVSCWSVKHTSEPGEPKTRLFEFVTRDSLSLNNKRDKIHEIKLRDSPAL